MKDRLRFTNFTDNRTAEDLLQEWSEPTDLLGEAGWDNLWTSYYAGKVPHPKTKNMFQGTTADIPEKYRAGVAAAQQGGEEKAKPTAAKKPAVPTAKPTAQKPTTVPGGLNDSDVDALIKDNPKISDGVKTLQGYAKKGGHDARAILRLAAGNVTPEEKAKMAKTMKAGDASKPYGIISAWIGNQIERTKDGSPTPRGTKDFRKIMHAVGEINGAHEEEKEWQSSETYKAKAKAKPTAKPTAQKPTTVPGGLNDSDVDALIKDNPKISDGVKTLQNYAKKTGHDMRAILRLAAGNVTPKEKAKMAKQMKAGDRSKPYGIISAWIGNQIERDKDGSPTPRGTKDFKKIMHAVGEINGAHEEEKEWQSSETYKEQQKQKPAKDRQSHTQEAPKEKTSVWKPGEKDMDNDTTNSMFDQLDKFMGKQVNYTDMKASRTGGTEAMPVMMHKGKPHHGLMKIEKGHKGNISVLFDHPLTGKRTKVLFPSHVGPEHLAKFLHQQMTKKVKPEDIKED